MTSMAEIVAGYDDIKFKKWINNLSEEAAKNIRYDWEFYARDNQRLPEGDWRTWLILAGRGFGKTRTGAETVRSWIESGKYGRIALVAPTAADARDVMIEGESGILEISPDWNRPLYEPSKRRLTWQNGAIAVAYSADEPDRLRGPQHDGAWADELASWRYTAAWDMLLFGLRLGSDPRAIITTTPKPIPLIHELMKDENTHVTTGNTFENLTNLAPAFLQQIVKKYEGTRLGRQELYAEILGDTEGALWTRQTLEETRVHEFPELKRIVVGIDPAISDKEKSDETGIIVAGLGMDDHAYILDDSSIKGSPDSWAKAAISAYHKHQADLIVCETNQGGDMVVYTLKTIDKRVPTKKLHASRGKQTRAEPISALYEQGRVHHVGFFSALEDQLTSWIPGKKSPDRMDALVWCLTELMLNHTDITNFKMDAGFTKASAWRL